MGTDVEAFMAACKVCQESKDPPREPLKPLAAAPSEPNVRVHAHLFQPGTVSAAGHKYVGDNQRFLETCCVSAAQGQGHRYSS